MNHPPEATWEGLRKDVGDRLHNGAWLLAKRPIPTRYVQEALGRYREPTYHTVVLTFHSGAGAEGTYAVGVSDSEGRVNPITYAYCNDIHTATYEYLHGTYPVEV